MNCPKCNAANGANGKFCIKCGFSLTGVNTVVSSSSNCFDCGAALKSPFKFCTSCGKKQPDFQSAEPTAPLPFSDSNASIAVVKDRIFWNIQKNEVAHRFNEAEMMQYDSAKGIIINEGTTAYIRANGVQVAEIKGGTYDFVDSQVLEDSLNQREGGLIGGIRSGFRFLSNLILGRRVKDGLEDGQAGQDGSSRDTMEELIESLKKGQVFSVTLKLDKGFPLVFDLKDVETKILNTDFGVHAFFKIDDFTKFSEYFLSDSNSVSAERIMKEMEPLFRSAIQEVVRDAELIEGRLSESVILAIKQRVSAVATELMHGLTMDKIIDISSRSEDLDRFRAFSSELYLSEKELDFLVRTNEYQNRLTLTQNAQRLTTARNETDLLRELNLINNSSVQGQLLSEDELDKFHMVLSREKRIREARNEDEINAALIEIEKTGLLRAEDLENLKRSIQERSEDHELQRFHTVTLLQMNQSLEIDRKKLEWEYEIGDKRIDQDISRRRKELQAEIGYTQLEIERWKTEDDYKDSLFYKNLERENAVQLQDLEIRKAKDEADYQEMLKRLELARLQQEDLARREAQKHDQEMASRAQELSHVKDLSQLDKEKDENLAKIYQGMTFEQIMAANPNMTPEAAAALAKQYESKAEAEKFKIAQLQNDMRAQDMKEMMDRMERMSNKVIDSSTSNKQELTDLKDQQKEEYRQRLERQEDRMDNTQDKALDYTTRNNSFGNVNTGSSTPPPPPMDFFVNIPGENSIPRKIESLIEMVRSGQITLQTSVFYPVKNSWVSASEIPEIQNLFPPMNDSGKNTSIKCRHCGIGISDNAVRFCPECGNEP